jgi:hypothetical protein
VGARGRVNLEATSSVYLAMPILYRRSVESSCLSRFVQKLFMVFDFAVNLSFGVKFRGLLLEFLKY